MKRIRVQRPVSRASDALAMQDASTVSAHTNRMQGGEAEILGYETHHDTVLLNSTKWR